MSIKLDIIMAKRKTHSRAGIISAIIKELMSLFKEIKEGKQVSFKEVAFRLSLAGFSGHLGGIMPDVIEPARHPNHRKHFHSIVAGVGVAYLSNKINEKSENPFVKTISRGIATGYVSHIILDSTTPTGVKLI